MSTAVNSQIYLVLEKYGISKDDVLDITELPSGINRVYLVSTSTQKLVLKNYIKLQSPKLDKVHSIIIKLMQDGIGIPEVLKNSDGKFLTKIEDANFDLSLFVEHVDLSDQIHISKPNLELAAKELAKIHKSTNRQEIISQLENIDFKEKAVKTIEKIKEFMTRFDEVMAKASKEDQEKLLLLKKIIELTEKHRKSGVDSFSEFLDQPFVPTHGDFSMLNVLISNDEKSAQIIDWDNFALRPLIWDLQAALSLFSCKYPGNAYIVEPDKDKLRTFLKAYLSENPLNKSQLKLLPEVVKYNFSIYWLSYTIPAMLEYDFRLLYLIPNDVEKALFWTKNIEAYQHFIDEFI